MEPPTDPRTLAQLVSEILDLTSGSGERLASEVGVSYASLYAWSRGRRRPSRAHARTLAQVADRRARRLAELAERLRSERGSEPRAAGLLLPPSPPDDDGPALPVEAPHPT
jgi:transcriptional regulator with XRE-family HTH domain